MFHPRPSLSDFKTAHNFVCNGEGLTEATFVLLLTISLNFLCTCTITLLLVCICSLIITGDPFYSSYIPSSVVVNRIIVRAINCNGQRAVVSGYL